MSKKTETKSFSNYIFTKYSWGISTIAIFFYGFYNNRVESGSDLLLLALSSIMLSLIALVLLFFTSFFLEIIFTEKGGFKNFTLALSIIFLPGLIMMIASTSIVTLIGSIYYFLLIGAWIQSETGWGGLAFQIALIVFCLIVASIV